MTTKTYNKLFEDYKAYLAADATLTDDVATFAEFLTNAGFSDVHANKLYAYYNDTASAPTVAKFKIRKMHPHRDRFLKKFCIPVVGTSALTGAGFAALSNSLATSANTNFLWIQLTSNPVINSINLGANGLLIGAAGAAGFIVAKNVATRAYYSARYGNSQTALKQLGEHTSLENTKIVKLISKIDKTADKILDLREGHWITALPRFVRKHALNIVNRNRIHHVEKVTKELLDKFKLKLNDESVSDLDKYNDVEMQNINKLLDRINKFVASDLERSSLYSLLSCKENKANHSHVIENADIYSTLAVYEELTMDKNCVDVKKATKNRIKDVDEKKEQAEQLVTGKRNLLQLAAKRYQALNPVAVVPTTPAITSFKPFFAGTIFELDNGKFLIVDNLDCSTGCVTDTDFNGTEIRVSFNTGAPDTIYTASKQLTKKAVDAIIEKRKSLMAIYNYIQTKRADLIAAIPDATDKKLNNLLVAIQNAVNTTATFKLPGAAATLYNKVILEFNADTSYRLGTP